MISTNVFVAYAATASVVFLGLPGVLRDSSRDGFAHRLVTLFLFAVAASYVVYIAGYRDLTAGFDTASYVRAYSAITDLSSAHAVGVDVFGSTELLFWPLQALIKSAGFSSRAWLVVMCLGSLSLMAVAYRFMASSYGLNWVVVVLVVFTYELVYMGNAMRQMVAFPVGIISVAFLSDRRFVLALLCYLTAVGLHWSSAVFIFAPLFWMSAFSGRRFVIVYLAAVLFLAQFATFGLLEVVTWYFEPLRSKVEHYSVAESHIAAVYLTANFWICVASLLVVVFFLNDYLPSRVFFSCFLLFSTLMLIGIHLPDFSERYMAQLLFFVPLVWVVAAKKLAQRLGWRLHLCAMVVAVNFAALGYAVLNQPSAQVTLGL